MRRKLLGGKGRQVQAAPALAPPSAPPIDSSRSRAVATGSQGIYVSAAGKFTMAMGFTFVWVAVSICISSAWVRQLEPVTGTVLAWTIVILVAYLPGAIVAFLASSLILDRQPPLHAESPTTLLTVIIAARNEERGIAETIAAISRTDYAGPVTVILADNGSTEARARWPGGLRRTWAFVCVSSRSWPRASRMP